MPERVTWSARTIERFWGYRSTRAHRQSEYFSFQVGAGIIEFLRWSGRLRGPVLDYGSGPGYLLEHLLGQGVRSAGADLSAEAVQATNERFRNLPGWMTCVRTEPDGSTPFPEGTFSVVTCVETLEHLPDPVVADVLGEIRRLVATDGIVLFTTPNDEDLEANLIYCPFCDTEFHPVQHLRSFDPGSLRRVLAAQGFDCLFVGGLDFGAFQRPLVPSWKDLSPRRLVEVLRRLRAGVTDRFQPRPFPEQRELREILSQGNHHLAAVAVPSPTNRGGAS